MFYSILPLIPLFAASTLSSPIASRAPEKCNGIAGPFLVPTFPDPSLYLADSTWYSFGTYNGKDFQAAKSSKLDSGWARNEGKTLAIEEAEWAGKGSNGAYGLWAPDVHQRMSDSKFVMYFSALDKEKTSQHCIGAAVSDKIEGIYHPESDFVQCNRTSTGVIDPAWFLDSDKKQYVVYKTEIPQNFLEIREVRNSGPKEGIEWVGNASKLLQVNSQGHNDGNNLEGPYIFKRGATYFLAYSTHFSGDGTYDVQYATAKNVLGPYTRVKEPLVKTTDAFGCKVVGPGGASFQRDAHGNEDVVRMIFHGLTDAMDINKRMVYTVEVQVEGDRLFIRQPDFQFGMKG